MSNYYGKTFAADEKAKATKKARRILGLPVAGFVAVVMTAVIGGGVALAAMLLSSNEAEAKLDKGVAAPLVLDNAAFVGGPLWPGTSVGLRFRVANTNPFPATVSKIELSGTSSTTCDLAKLTGPASDIGTVNNLTLTLATPVQVAAGGEQYVTYPKVVSLASSATDSCAITAKFKVTGTGAGPGN